MISLNINSYSTANICCTIHNCTTCRILQDYGRRPAPHRRGAVGGTLTSALCPPRPAASANPTCVCWTSDRITYLFRTGLLLNSAGDQYFHKCCLINAALVYLYHKFACESTSGLKIQFKPRSSDSSWPTGEPALSCCYSSAEKRPFISLLRRSGDGFILKHYSDDSETEKGSCDTTRLGLIPSPVVPAL